MYTTPAPEVDITAIIPELSEWRRTTVRLHPRPGNPREVDSHIGGPMLDVEGSARPACEEHPMDYDGRDMPRPMESVAQFFRRDFPEIPYPAGCDLLQVYWCPNDHYMEYADSDYEGPAVSLEWLDSVNAAEGARENPFHRVQPCNESYDLRPCRITPERVIEFPWMEELPDDIARRLVTVDQERGLRYQYALSVAYGWKIGGWPSWHATDKRNLSCPDCEGGVELLLKADSSEWDGASDRWWPLEDRELDQQALKVAYSPTGAEVGRFGELRVFVCRNDVRHQPVLDMQ
ncbi:hypothetical protein [Streptomyces cyaneus]|uniref:hypothetical protein n=1 Tax=Streptomyces cyaneus TaxID=1904 RepID=UPI000FF88C54|nr:hypothetical protein [Streptomyces cyaneus]